MHICFSKKCFAETPMFIVFLGACFWGQVVNKGKFWTPTKKTNGLIIEKLFWGGGGIFVFFVLSFSFFVFFWGGCFLGV